MILIIQICKEKLHYYEFVKPIEDVLKQKKIDYQTFYYKNLFQKSLLKYDKIIISGTSLKDNDFFENINHFKWIHSFDKPILGICAGMHILGLQYGGLLKKYREIGLKKIMFKKEFLSIKNNLEVYELHNFYVKSKDFKVYAFSEDCIQAIKHREKPFYGVLFHPEVRNKKMIETFTKNHQIDH
jgi:GMP synthase (glutamine-hydrolysing)